MTSQGNPPTPGPVPVEVPEGLTAVYSNLVQITHSPSDFVIDFGQVLPLQKPRITARVVMAPIALKSFLYALTENLARYEAANGEVHMPGDSSLANDLFKQIKPPDPPKE